MQPATIEMGLDLSPAVAERFPELLAKVVEEVSGWRQSVEN
jgi:hypothetical protein